MLIENLIINNRDLSLDSLLMIINYVSVTNIRFLDEFKKRLLSIINPELSLYSLASAFFKKKPKEFFSLWARKKDDYTYPFWVAYWSNQLWRALNFIELSKMHNFSYARRFSYGLPMSFTKSDWKKASTSEIRAAHDMIYDIDFAFKTGSSFSSLDLFYSKYFLGNFG